jgi:5-methylcytosine-specific restriction endonuclease McrA
MVYWLKDILMKRKPNTACVLCKTAIYRRPLEIATGNVYCSLTCMGITQRAERTCRMCQKKYLGTKKTCSRSCANRARAGIKYTGVQAANRATKSTLLKEKIAYARGGICEQCSEDNFAILQSHLKVERYRGGSDSLSNLELLCPNCHATRQLGKRLFASDKNDRVHR